VPAADVSAVGSAAAPPGVAAVGWVSVEGLNGVGKTFLTSRLAARLGPTCRVLSELTDHGPDGLTGRVIAAMSRPGGTFLRTGHPLTETFALLALKVYEYEHLRRTREPNAAPVVEDRGPDTVAVYQAAIMTAGQPHAAAAGLVEAILSAAAMWRPLPDVTLLLVDDLDTCIDRFAARLGTAVDLADREMLSRVDRLYRDLAAAHPHRFRIINRAGRTADDVLAEMHAHCRTIGTEAFAS
jgi:dTMP kinase